MNQTQPIKIAPSRADHTGKDPLAGIRAAAQELHGAISDAAVQRGQAIKDHLQAIGPTVTSLISSVKTVIGDQNEVAKEHLAEAVTHLEGAKTQIATGLKSTGDAFQAATRQALADSHDAVQKISEVVAATRSAHANTKQKV